MNVRVAFGSMPLVTELGSNDKGKADTKFPIKPRKSLVEHNLRVA